MKKILKFSLVGITNTIVSTLFYWLFLKNEVPPNLSYFLSYFIATINAIWINSHWTFIVSWQSPILWIKAIILNSSIAFIVSFIVPSIIKAGIPVQYAQIALVPITLGVSYAISKSWVFVKPTLRTHP